MSDSNRSLATWLSDLENRYVDEIQLGLHRIRYVAERSQLLACAVPVITVAGTNGKGSTVAALEAIYVASGYQVGCYTSPHLFCFNERIRVNQTPISDEALCQAFQWVEQQRGETALTYFEMTTLAALWYFQQSALDVIVLEVGMGGRLDATNIIDADLSIITTVDYDHQAFLGTTKEAIGFEKAGIMRTGAPCIYADEQPPSSVVAFAKQQQVPLYCLSQQYHIQQSPEHMAIFFGHSNATEATGLAYLPKPQINVKAAAAAVLASHLLRDRLPVPMTGWEQAMRSVVMVGRQQLVQTPIPTIIDVAHNPQSVQLLADRLHQFTPKKAVHVVFAALTDKDLCGLLKPLVGLADYWYPALLSGKRASTQAQMSLAMQQVLGLDLLCDACPSKAYQAALTQAKQGDVIVVYGSFLTVAAVMSNQQWEELL